MTSSQHPSGKLFLANPNVIGFLLGCVAAPVASLALSIVFAGHEWIVMPAYFSFDIFLRTALSAFIFSVTVSFIPAGLCGCFIGFFVKTRIEYSTSRKFSSLFIGVLFGAITGFVIFHLLTFFLVIWPDTYYRILVSPFFSGEWHQFESFLVVYQDFLFEFSPLILVFVLISAGIGMWIARTILKILDPNS